MNSLRTTVPFYPNVFPYSIALAAENNCNKWEHCTEFVINPTPPFPATHYNLVQFFVVVVVVGIRSLERVQGIKKTQTGFYYDGNFGI